MNTLVAFPDWVPWWVPMVLLVPALLYALAFLFMPFSVLGVKTRLEVIESRLDEIQQEIRHLALRLPVGPREVDFEDVYAPIQQVAAQGRRRQRPPAHPSRRSGPLWRRRCCGAPSAIADDAPRAASGAAGGAARPRGAAAGPAPVVRRAPQADEARAMPPRSSRSLDALAAVS